MTINIKRPEGITWVIKYGEKTLYIEGEVYSSIVKFANAIREDLNLPFGAVKFRAIKNLPR